jgi:hypothetical protein
MARAKSALINLGSLNDFETLGSHFELRRGRRAIAGADPTAEDFRVEVVVTLLDSLRVHAVRAEPR